MGSLLKTVSNVSGLSFRTDSDIEEKRQNAIEQVTKSHPLLMIQNLV